MLRFTHALQLRLCLCLRNLNGILCILAQLVILLLASNALIPIERGGRATL